MREGNSAPDRSLKAALAALSKLGVAAKAEARLEASMGSAAATLQREVLSEIPAFAASANPEILPSLKSHAYDHLREIRRLFSGGSLQDFAFVREHARLRAEQRFPLEATLHAYRCGHRAVSRWLREAATATGPKNLEEIVVAIADFSIEYTDAISTIVTAEYVAHTRVLAEAERDQRSELLGILLSGYDELDARVAQLLRRAGYLEQRLGYCVAVAQSVNAAEMERPARAQRVAAALELAVAGTSIRTLTGARDSLAIAVFSDRRRVSGWTAAGADLAERLRERMLSLGPAVIVGLSADHPSTAYIAKALSEAKVALDFAAPARRVVGFRELPVRGLLVRHGAAYLQAAAPAWAQTLVAADAKAEGALAATVRALAAADLNVQEAGRALKKHPNTIYARIARLQALTGVDARRFEGLNELLLVIECWRI